MRTARNIAIALALVAAQAQAGRVTFAPSSVTMAAGQTREIEVNVTVEELASFVGVEMIIGSRDLTVEGFEYDQLWITAQASGTQLIEPVPRLIENYNSALYLGGVASDSRREDLIGVVTISAAGLADGSYTLSVDSLSDGGTSYLVGSDGTEDLLGTLVVTISGDVGPDSDGDGVPDEEDVAPNDASESIDTDGDGIGNNTDIDDDGDDVLDVDDADPLDPNVQTEDDIVTDNDNDNTTHNMTTGPRASSGICGSSLLGTALITLTCLLGLRLTRARFLVRA